MFCYYYFEDEYYEFEAHVGEGARQKLRVHPERVKKREVKKAKAVEQIRLMAFLAFHDYTAEDIQDTLNISQALYVKLKKNAQYGKEYSKLVEKSFKEAKKTLITKRRRAKENVE